MKPLIRIFLFFLLVPASGQATSMYLFPLNNSCNIGQANPVKTNKDSIQYQIINVTNMRYGYDIYIRSRMVIHQPVVPCQPGKNGFRRKEDARKVALLVIGKIRRGEMPPAVTLQEMKHLNVLE